MIFTIQYMVQQLGHLIRSRTDLDERGAAMVEYALLVALIAAVCVGVIATLGTSISGIFSGVSTKLSTVGSGS